MENNMIIAIDLGTSHSRVVAGTPAPDKPYGLNILFYADMNSQGMRRGTVYNKDEVGKVVSNLLLAADKKLNSTKKRPAKSAIVVNIGGTGFTSSILKKSLPLYGQPVTPRTLTAIEKMAQEDKQSYLIEEDILHTSVISYSIDNEPSTDDVLNRSGSTLEAKFLCICGKKKNVSSIIGSFPQKAVPTNIYTSASAKALVSLSPAQRRDGVALVDMGGGTTSIAVFYRDALQYEISVPIGSDTITHDIAVGFEISDADAERIKCGVGIVGEQEAKNTYMVKLPSGESLEFSGAKLNFIIRARVEEIGAYVYTAIQEAIKRGCPRDLKIALTGGGAKLHGVDKIIQSQTELETMFASPIGIGSLNAEEVGKYAGAIGMASIWVRENDVPQEEQPTLKFAEEAEPAVKAQQPQDPAESAKAGEQDRTPEQPAAKQEAKKQEKDAEANKKEEEVHNSWFKNTIKVIGKSFNNMMDDDFNSK